MSRRSSPSPKVLSKGLHLIHGGDSVKAAAGLSFIFSSFFFSSWMSQRVDKYNPDKSAKRGAWRWI